MNGWITQGMKISHKHKRRTYPSVGTVTKQKQKHITLNIVKSPPELQKKLRSNTTVDLQQNLITK